MNCADHLRLVAITDNLRDGIEGLKGRAEAAERGGATMIQLRLPDEAPRTLAAAARALVSAVKIPVVVHGRVDVAIAAGAAGVHLGVHDLAVADVRRLLGDNSFVGRSAGTPADFARATKADYVTLGPVFTVDARRPQGAIGISNLEIMARDAPMPVVAIGGITTVTAGDAIRAGAAGVALISGIFGARDPERAAREVRSASGT